MTDDVAELTKTEEWFRDRLTNLLQLGGAGFLIAKGWLISHDSLFSLSHRNDPERMEAAIFLCIAVPLAFAVWYGLLLNTHSQCPVHPTVIRRKFLHLRVLAIGVALLVILFLSVEGRSILPGLG